MPVYYLLTTVKDLVLTQEQFDSLLDWLDHDSERAGRQYESIRKSLIDIFIWRGCNDAEDLADETINRVASKVKELKGEYHGNPVLYFFGVAKKVMQEQRRSEQRRVQINSIISSIPNLYSYDEETETMLEALDDCLSVMAEDDRALILRYYEGEKQSKIRHRKVLAQEFQLTEPALRKRVQRLRVKLYECIHERFNRFTETMRDDT